MYGSGSPARAIFGTISVEIIPTAAGFSLRNRLIERLGEPATPTHVLAVDLEIDTDGVALTDENITTRFDVTGVAEYVLTPIGGAQPAFADKAIAIAGYSAPELETASAFASRAAEEDAVVRVTRLLAEQIVARLAQTAETWAADPPGQAPE